MYLRWVGSEGEDMKSTQETAPKSLKVSFSEALKKKKKKTESAPLPNGHSLLVPHSTFCPAHPSMANYRGPANDSQIFRARFQEIL